jgi:hypothetical protein
VRGRQFDLGHSWPLSVLVLFHVEQRAGSRSTWNMTPARCPYLR